jgi:uncharacterized flavoprotein (TIGR03862 family)
MTGERPTAAVVGGGPAGLIAAEVLATEGWAVTVYDHMPSMGRKLVLAGRGGLNITHGEPLEQLLGRYGAGRPALEPALRGWDPDRLRAWCAGLGEPTFVGSSGRVFPTSFRATPLLRAWLARLAELGVGLAPRHRLVDISVSTGRPMVGFTTADDRVDATADAVVLALGGASWPRVGSDGGWTTLLADAGVAITPMRPANCGLCIVWRPQFLVRHEGAPVKNVALSCGDQTVRGDVVITNAGIEGGPVYAVSASARDTIDRDGECTVSIDLLPDLDVRQIAARLGRARAGDSVSSALRKALGLSPVAIALAHELGGRHLPAEPAAMARLLTALPFRTSATMPIDRSISTAGGIALDEIDDRFMLRRLPGVFVAGEMLDWEAPTGGYLLQASFSTGVAAARGAIARRDAGRPARVAVQTIRST